MANLRKRIQKLTKLRGPVEQKGINSLDLFLVGALTGLYSKKLLIQNDTQKVSKVSDSGSAQVTKTQLSQDEQANGKEYSAKIKSISTTDRLSNSVSDYVLKLEKQDYSDYARGFYTSQLDNLAKAFTVPSNTAGLTEFAEQSIASMKREKDEAKRIAKEDSKEIPDEKFTKNAKQAEQEKADDIEKASGDNAKEPSYQEILDTFRKGLEGEPLEPDKSAKKEADVVKTAKADSNFYPAEQNSPEKNQDIVEAAEGSVADSTVSEERVDLAQADPPDTPESSSGESSSAPSSAAEAAASAPTSIFGSIAMVPVAAVGLTQVVNKLTESSPSVLVEQPSEPEEVVPETPVVEQPVEQPVVVPVPSGGGSPEIAAAPEPVLAFQGRVVDGYVVGATVFYDENNNGILDDSESGYVGVTDADGNFQLPDFSAAAQGGSVVVLPGGVDTNTGHKIGAMQVNVPKDADGNPILSDPDSPDAQAAISSPLTLILAQNADIVEADLIAQLGMTGVEEKGLAFYDPVNEMQAGNNNSLAEYVFTVQQQLFSIIQAGSKIAGEAAGLSALEVSVQAVGDAMKTALENGTALTIDSITTSAITSVANASGFSNLASNFASIVQTTNQKIAEGYGGMALALSDPSNDESITLLSNARATAAASQDTLLSTIETSLSSGTLDTAAFNTSLNAVISENSAVFGTLLTAEAGDGSSGLSEFGNPAFIVTKLLEQTGSATRDIVDLSSSINSLSLGQLSQLGVSHVRLLGSNTAVEISMGDVSDAVLASLNDDATVDDVNTTLVDESSVDDGLFASNYTVTLKVTDAQVASVVSNATALNAAGIDVIKPVEGTLTLTLSQVRDLQSLGFEFASGLVRFSASSGDSLTFDEIYTLLNTGLKLTDSSEVSVSIPDGDSRSTFATIKDLAARGVAFDGGTITLTQDDLKGSFNVLQAQLLDAAKSNIVFDTENVSSWSLGKAYDGTSLGNPKINAADVTHLVNAGINFNDAVVNVTSTGDVTTIVNNAFELLSAGVRKFNFASGVSVSTSDARTILDAKDLTIEQGTSYTDVIFSGEGTLSNLGSASLQSLSDFLAEGLGLDTTFVPEYADALALVQLGITFPQGITLQTTTETTISQSDANTLVNAGVKFQGLFNVSFQKDGSITEAANLTAVSNLISAGLRPVAPDGQKITISGSNSDPLYIRPNDWNALKDYVDLENASLVLTRSSDFLTAFGDLTSNQSFWESQTQFSKFAVPLSVTPVYSQLKTLADLNTTRSGDGTTPISIVRVSKSGDAFTELDTNISIRISSATDLDAVDASSLKNSGVDIVDVLGVPLTVSQIQNFLSNDAPLLQNAQLLISNINVSDASALLQQSFDRDIFDAGISGFGVATGTSTTADVWKVFSDAYDNLSGDSNSATTRIFDGGIITGAGGLTSGVGQVLDRLGRAGLKLSDSYSPSLTEVREYIDSGGSYSKGIKIGLQDGETLGPNEAISLAQANVSFTANTPLDFTGQTSGTLTNAGTEALQVVYFQKLLEKGFLLQNVSADLLNLNGVTVSQDVFELFNSNGFNFTNSKITVTNKMELVSAAVKVASTEDHGITHIQVPETIVPSFGQAKLLLSAGLGFEMVSSDGSTITDSGTIVKASSVSQLESLARQLNSLESMGVSSLDLEGLQIPVSVAKIFVEASESTNISFLNQPKLLISSDDNLSDIPSILNELISLGVREITFSDNVEVNALAAHNITQASDQITFSNGFVTDSEGVQDDELKTVLASLKQKGMPVSPNFKPSLDIALTGNAQTDSENMMVMIRDGYKVKLQATDGGLIEEEDRAEVSFANVFLSLREFTNFANSENFDGSSALPKFTQSFVTAKNNQELNVISTDLQSESSILLQLGIENIALLGNLSPSLSQVQLAGVNGLALQRVSKVEDSFNILSGSEGKITLKIEESEIASITANAAEIFSSGVERLNLFGKEIAVEDAATLVNNGFTFEGGKIASVSSADQNTLSYLRPLAQAGLGLPNDVTLKDSTVSLDFALNRFKGTLEGASIDLSDKQGDEAITTNQVLRLINRDHGTGLSEGNKAYVSLDESVAVQIAFSTSDELTESTATRLADLGFEEVVGEVNPKSSVNLMEHSTLNLQNVKVKGNGELSDLLTIVNTGNGNLIDGASLQENTTTDLESIKSLFEIDFNKLNLNDVELSDLRITPDDFLDVKDRVSFSDTAVISGRIDSTAKGVELLDEATIPLDGVLLKNERGPILSDAPTLVTLAQNGVSLFDQIDPTVIVTTLGLTVQEALVLGEAQLDLSNHHILAGEHADILQAVSLHKLEGLDILGLKIEKGEELKSTAIENVQALQNAGVVFDGTGTEKLFTVDEDIIGPFQAIDLNTLGADLSSKQVEVEGSFVPAELATQLSEIQGVDLSSVLTRKESLSSQQIQELESRGVRVDQDVELILKDSNLNGQVTELQEFDPTDSEHTLVSEGSVFLKNDIHSTYLPETDFASNNLVGNLNLDINGTTDPTIQRLDWTYSVLADEVEYLSHGDVLEENFNIKLSENFVGFVSEDVVQFDVNLGVVGTDDQPEIIFEETSDIDVLLREGKDNAASGELLISERDMNDEISISVEIPQSVVRDGGTQGSDSIFIPIDFELRNTENNELVWQYDRGNQASQDTNLLQNSESLEIFVPALSAGEYEFEWALSDLTDIYNGLQPGQILEASYVVKVSDTDDLRNDADIVTQNISIDIQANNSPVLVDPDNPPVDGVFIAPTLNRSGTEDQDLILTPEDFGLEFYVDADNDLYTNIQIVSVSDDINLGYVRDDVEGRGFDLLSGGEIISLDHTSDFSKFILNDSAVDLVVRPNDDINGTEFIEFRVGDSVDFSEQIYTSSIFFSPVVDAPSVHVRNTMLADNSDLKNIKFIGDESTIYFELTPTGQSSEIMRAEISIQQGNAVLYNKEFDEESLVEDYTVNLVDIVNTFNEIDTNVDNRNEYIFTDALEAQFTVEIEDRVDGTDKVDSGSFEFVEEITVIPDASRIKNDSGYRETLVGFSSFDDSSSDFSEFGENDDITYIDPDFGSVLSSDDSLDGHEIDYDASVILGTKGDDYVFAKSDHELENGNLVHGIEGFDDLSGGEYRDIIYVDYVDDGTQDTVGGGMGDDVFVFHGNNSANDTVNSSLGNESKQDMNNRLENLLTRESIDADDVTLAGTVQDFSIAKKGNADSIVLSGFSEDASHSLHTDDDWTLLLVEDDNQEKLYTAAILMSEYGAFDSSDMDLMNDAIHKI